MTKKKFNKIEKIIIFIDGSNLYHSLGRIFNNEKTDFFNFEKFIKSIANGRKVIETHYYIGIFTESITLKAMQTSRDFSVS